MNNFKAPKIGYIDSNGKFISLEIDSITNEPITSSNIGSRMTVEPSFDHCAINKDYTTMTCTKTYTDKYVEDKYIENMFDKIFGGGANALLISHINVSSKGGVF